MERKLNFSAGPAALPLSVLEQVKEEFVDFNGAGLSLIESSHRTALYDDVHMETMTLIRELMGVSEDYDVMFLGGGATMQFGMIPMNFLKAGGSADYVNSGAWAKKAIADAKKIGNVNVVWDGADVNYASLPGKVSSSPDASYFHLTSNETIGGVQWKEFPETGNVPLIADMSSDIMSRPINVADFGMIYAGAQKNIGPAGVTLVIMKKELLESASDRFPAYLTYKNHAAKSSMYNTPPVFPIYVMNLVMKWLKSLGGIEGIQAINDKKAALLYSTIDGSKDYYKSPVDTAYRSSMNVVFTTPSPDLDKKFLSEAADLGMISLKGYRDVGGCRASIYNAMPLEGVEKLASFMKDFASKN
ncbi:MAG: 3-phosphoserine/phosphohydroxythreonine transaminase [Spirochaetales bacterium]|nr:3-phosphoserine/phosphohydroxythreonine transaminase [Spirochaetales bacterium]